MSSTLKKNINPIKKPIKKQPKTFFMSSNLLDQVVPEIKQPILKPTKRFQPSSLKHMAKKIASLVKNQLNKFADWIISYVPKDIKKKVNTRVEALKKEVNNIYENLKVPATKAKQKNSALKGFLKSYRIKGEVKTDSKTFLENSKQDVINLLKHHEKPIKMKFLLECEFYKMDKKEKVYTYGYFHSTIEIVTESTNLDEVYNRFKDQILEKVDNFQNQGSGWIFKKVVNLDINIDKYKPISGKSYIELPRILKRKEAIVNTKNEDNQCFKWAMTNAIFPIKKNSERISKVLKANAEKLNWNGLDFPVQVDKICIFEKNNTKYRVNVYGYQDDEVYPLRISKKNIREQTINLLLISNDKTNHYCWIKSMSRLCSAQINKNGHGLYFCERCLNSFKTEKSLKKHSEYCKNQDAIKITLPKKGTMLKFKNYNNSMRVPFVIYADFECFTENISSCQPDEGRSYTEKYQKHKPSGYCFMIKCYDDKLYKPEMVRYTAKSDGEDIGQHFVNSIEKSVRGLYSKFNYNKKVKMTAKDNRNYKKATECHICEKELGKDKVLDHDHLTGRYRGAAHNDCNLNYKIPKHIPVIFHNLSGYDAHLFIKKPRSYRW